MLELKQGTQLAGRYLLDRRLGGTGQATIWLAKDRMTKASVALKIVQGSDAAGDRFRSEWQSSIRLVHSHIVRAFEYHAEPELALFSQQFIDGPDIGVLAGSSPANILGTVSLLLDAVAYIHGRDIVHRDIKASNVLLDVNGAPYLSDFGSAANVGARASATTPVAASPQSLAGDPVSTGDDVFALGTLVYELIAGRPPWNDSDIESEILAAQPAALVAADGSQIDAGIQALVARMLDRDPGQRPAAARIRDELSRLGISGRAASYSRDGYVTTSALPDEKIESRESIRPVAPASGSQIPAAGPVETPGLSPKTVGISLAALVLVLIGVIFVLPDSVDDDSSATDDSPSVADVAADTAAARDVAEPPSGPREEVFVDPEIRKRMQSEIEAPTRKLDDDDDITFSENRADYSGLDDAGLERFTAERTLGELLSELEVLEGRGVEIWAPREHSKARDLYEKGDKAYLEKDFAYAEELYLGALTVIEPLFERIEPTFEEAYQGAAAAFEAGDRLEALRLYELAVAVTPSHAGALAGYERARNLESVLRLVEQGVDYEEDLELDAAERSFTEALGLDAEWQPAQDGVDRVKAARLKLEFDTRMSEGFAALSAGDYLGARAAFRVAERLYPDSAEPGDGLLQVEQGLRLQEISTLEQEALALEADEHWDAVVATYEELLKVDNTLTFAKEGLANARRMSALHSQLDRYVTEPDRLSVPKVMQEATNLLVGITTRPDVGPRLASQRDELSRLLRRAATPLTVPIVSDNSTDVFIYKVGKMGRFMRKEINLRPGTYVVVGSRAGYRDVRLEFRVAPEIDMEPVVVQCEEPI